MPMCLVVKWGGIHLIGLRPHTPLVIELKALEIESIFSFSRFIAEAFRIKRFYLSHWDRSNFPRTSSGSQFD